MNHTEALRAALKAARDIAAKAEGEERDLTPEERKAVEDHLAKAKTHRADAELEAALAGLEGEIEALEGNPARPIDSVTGFRALTGKTLGSHFTEDEGVKAWLKGNNDGRFSEKARVQSPPVGFQGLKAIGYGPGTGRPEGRKALVTGASDTSAGALVDEDFLGLQDEGTYARPLNVLDVITRGNTTSDTVEYVRVTTTTNAAAPVPEATQVGESGDEEATKPESAIALEKVTETVKTIAHWLPATKRALSDAAQVRTLIDNFLRYGLLEELEDQIINGDGTGENFPGILNTPNVQVQSWDTDLLATARKAKTKVRVVGRANANAYLLHPNDAERLDLLKDDQGRYYYGGPAQDGAQPLWRLPVVETEAVGEGVGICGDFRRAVLWDREESSIAVSDSHNDFFIRNLVAILAELRAAFGVLRPTAFVQFPTTASESSA